MYKSGASFDIYLDSICYSLGEILPISSIAELRSEAKLLDRYQSLGFEYYSKSENSAIEMAVMSAQKTLKQSTIKRSEIDLVIFDTFAHWERNDFNELAVNSMLLELGLDRKRSTNTTLASSF